MTAHYFGNFPIFLMSWDVGDLGKEAWAVLLQLWIIVYFIAAVALLSYFSYGKMSPGRLIYGRRECPECHAEHDAPLLYALNFGMTRYERCPHCRRWHWTSPSSVRLES